MHASKVTQASSRVLWWFYFNIQIISSVYSVDFRLTSHTLLICLLSSTRETSTKTANWVFRIFSSLLCEAQQKLEKGCKNFSRNSVKASTHRASFERVWGKFECKYLVLAGELINGSVAQHTWPFLRENANYKAAQINKAELAAANRRPLAYGGDGQRCAQLG